jgi:hypothetical protein
MRPLVRLACGGNSEAEQLGILSMRGECPKGRGQFSLRWERRPHRAGRERQQGCLPALKGNARKDYSFTHAREC